MKIKPWPLILSVGVIAPLIPIIFQYVSPSINDLENTSVVLALPITLGVSAAVYAVFEAVVKSEKAREFAAVMVASLVIILNLMGLILRG